MIARFVLSTFPGCGNLDRGFIAAGYNVVCSGDPLFGQPGLEWLRTPPDVFEGIIGGPPCLPWATTRRGTPRPAPQPHTTLRASRRVVVGQSVPVQVATRLANAILIAIEGA